MLIAVFAGIAAALTAAGIYAVFSYLVSRRTQEMGLRVALGANRGQIVRLVISSALRVTLIGIAAGVCAALGLGRVLTSQFNAIRPDDPGALALVAGLLVVVALLACLRPALRATRVDPLVALRQE